MCPFNISFILKILMQGTQIAFEYFIWIFKKCKRTSPLFQKVYFYALEAIQKIIESSPNFLKANRVSTPLSKNGKEFQYIHEPIGKRAQTICNRIQPIEKRNQSGDALAFFENSNEIP